MDHGDAHAFVDRWLECWNDRDVERVLGLFTDDVVFTSPLAAQLFEESGGVVRGKSALREYWSEGLRRNPELRFELLDFYVGVQSIVINFRNHKGGLVNEVLIFDGDLVSQGHATYPNEA